MRLFALLSVLLVAGCTRPDYAAIDHARCLQFGFQENTDSYRYCRMQLVVARENAEANERAAFGAMMMGNQLRRTVP